MYEEKNMKIKKPKKDKKEPRKFTLKRRFYTSNSVIYKIEWNKLGTKMIVLFIAVMLIIFTISRINKHQKNTNEEYDSIVDTITDATIKYYQYNTLPKNIGESNSMFLKDMRNIGLIDEIKDSSNNTCNYDNSYYIITKSKDNEYILKIYLECPKKEVITEKKLICENNNCIKK